MTTYTHKLFGTTYTPVAVLSEGVLFEAVETGEQRVFTEHQIVRLLKKNG